MSQSYTSALTGNFCRVMTLMLRQSIAQGVKRMLKIYRLRKWFSAQTVIHNMSLRLRWNGGMRLLANMDLAYSMPHIGDVMVEDTAAPSWIIREAEFYRTE